MNSYHKTGEQLREELQLIQEAKKDPARFSVLYDYYYKPVYVFVFRRCGDEDVTGDIVSATFLKALLALPKYQFKGVPFSAWLFRIALNEVNMFYRQGEKQRHVSLEQTDLSDMITESGAQDDEERRQELLKALTILKPEEMMMIELRFFEKRAFAEIGGILGMTENNAKVKTYRILDKLKTELMKTSLR